jgi:hypothetical protein
MHLLRDYDFSKMSSFMFHRCLNDYLLIVWPQALYLFTQFINFMEEILQDC